MRWLSSMCTLSLNYILHKIQAYHFIKILLHSQLINSPIVQKSFFVNIKSDSLNFNVFVVFLLRHLPFSSPNIKCFPSFFILSSWWCIQFQYLCSERGASLWLFSFNYTSFTFPKKWLIITVWSIKVLLYQVFKPHQKL